MNTNKDLQVHFYRELLRIRRTEEILADEYRTGSMRTPTHFGIGQEAVAVGVSKALTIQDVVYTHHRCHTHYLAKGGDLLGLVAELLGREAGCSRGRGGSVHLTDRSVGFVGSSPILGHSSALAAGSALAFSMDKLPHIAVGFFGEGACDEGSVWESFNYASVHKLPVLFVCENNLYATESPMSVRQADGTDLCERARSFKLRAERVDGNDVNAVYQAAQSAVDACRAGEGPTFLECMTYRWREHVGPLWDYEVNRAYRTKKELEEWMEKCPLVRSGNLLVTQGMASAGDLKQWQSEVDAEVNEAIVQGKKSPWPETSTLFDNVY
ncbi:MAG: thiamine pyrophosphate-dependent dehydrogenase E1 component subunit alpha [Polaromonas sp.]|uniref:thiamine pyrophosphate-dependent dehydrogenase E1 component subunit alpha n=1 Tax=Polaromonas sp. TaxID=1869339 RepID=UPI002489DBB2|nr:thiamine pyrophosphate-dependent dehydrogenase E1 component subunit alpha [Polaromonas sp.]MDI1270391.1 thiamine pyrophosphate-dependent dehydrogenase E1 component subunit alpha [Polaromonas sp.]